VVRHLREPLRSIRSLLRRRQEEQQLSEELQFHLERQIEQNLAAGMPPEEARYAALRLFGGVQQIKEECRDMRRVNYLGNFIQDLRFGFRQLTKNPGFTAVVVLSLALGVGANVTIFTFVSALLFRPPAVKDSGRLLEVWQRNTNSSGVEGFTPLSYPGYSYYHDHTQTFEGLLAFDGEMRPVTWSQSGEGGLIQGQLVSGNFFSILGINPLIGRTFLPEEDRVPSSNPVVVLSHSFWKQRLGADGNVPGKAFALNGKDFTVVGVAPAGFTGIIVGNIPDFWAPLSAAQDFTHDPNFLSNWNSFWLFAIGRLKPGLNAAQAGAEMALLSRRLQQDHHEGYKDLEAATFPVNLVPSPFRGYVAAFTGLLMAVVGLVLLIACANAANLLLAKGIARQREIAVRSALGASRGRLIRQTLTESLLLSLMGGAAGIVLALLAVPALLNLKPPSLPMRIEAPMDWRVLAFTLLLALVTGVLFGIAPALRSSKLALVSGLKDELSIAGVRGSRLRNLLVIGQVCICLVLLIGAGLCVRSLLNARSIDPGFDVRHTLIAEVDPGSLGYSEARGKAFYRAMLDRLEALPGVRSASFAAYLPLTTAMNTQGFVIGQHKTSLETVYVGPAFCRTMDMLTLRGRDFVASDSAVSPKPVIVNEAMARRFWPGQDPIGKSLGFADEGSHNGLVIVGMVKTGKYRTLSEAPQPVIYLPTDYQPRATLVVRTDGDPRGLLASLRREAQALDPMVVPVDLETMSEYMTLPLFPVRTAGLLLGAFGALALVLAVAGLYGLISYSVSQRTHEIGVRMALGAERIHVLKSVVGMGMRLTLIGVACGLAGAFAVTRVLSSLLYGIRPTDPLTFIGAPFILTVVALTASYVPARRATEVDPMAALRYE
jgi:predicted permease